MREYTLSDGKTVRTEALTRYLICWGGAILFRRKHLPAAMEVMRNQRGQDSFGTYRDLELIDQETGISYKLNESGDELIYVASRY